MSGKRLAVLAAFAVIGLIATGWIDYWSTRAMEQTVAALDHTRDVLLAIDRVRATLAESEAAARGYVITGAPVLLWQFQRATAALSSSTAQLTTFAADRRLHRTAAGLDDLVSRRLALLRRLAASRAGDGDVTALVLEGTSVSIAIRNLLDSVRTEEVQRFDREERRQRRQPGSRWSDRRSALS